MLKGNRFLWILLFVTSCLIIQEVNTLAGRCFANGRAYRDGETTVQRLNHNRLYKCTCRVSPTGAAQRNCSHSKEDAQVLIADVNKITKVLLGGGYGFKIDYIQNLDGIAVAVDVDYESDFIYWTDVSNLRRGIYRARFSDGSLITRIVSEEIYEPNGIAVDWLSKNIYWTDAQLGAIFVARGDGRQRSLLIGGLSEPRGIVLLPREGLMFWSDQSRGTIESARMDGSDRRIIVNGLTWPNEIAVNRLSRRIYWVDGYTRVIQGCNFDGGSFRQELDFSHIYKGNAFGLSLFDDHLYFGIWNESAMFSITTIGQNFKPVVRNLNSNPMGITIVNRKMQYHDRHTNPCWLRGSFGSSPCSHLCLSVTYNTYRCACPSNTGLVLSRDGRTCATPETFLLYTSIGDGTVMMVSTEFGASRTPAMLAQSHQPSAVAFDPVERVVYWSDVGMSRIYRKRLGDSAPSVFIEDGIGTVDGLCVDAVNRHLYFSNMGWNDQQSTFHHIEMVKLNDVRERKILTSAFIDKPRDILIDQENQFLYVSDWGVRSQIVRFDLNGQHPHIIELEVENPNGMALVAPHIGNHILYVTDSHAKSALMSANGTVVYGQGPTFLRYDTVLGTHYDMDEVNMEIPFGLAAGQNKLYMTDWGLGGIYEVDPRGGGAREVVVGIEKPTGIAYASLDFETSENACTRSQPCSDICFPGDLSRYLCVCPDRAGMALSGNNWKCVVPDTFLLVADGNRIVMKSFDPEDNQQYAVVRTFDQLSNIVAVTYDPITSYVYWVDNGRQRISRKNLGDKNAGPDEFETIYTNIGSVDGIALDTDHRLLYWTDSEKGTIEMLTLTSNMLHTTVRTQLSSPRAIVLNPDTGVMYWSESGEAPMVMSSTMSGQDIRPILTTGLKWPNGLYFDKESSLLYIADGGTLEIKSVPTTGDVAILDHTNENGTAGHIYGLWKYSSRDGVSYIYSDWYNKTVISNSFHHSRVLMDNMVRPSQIYIQQPHQQRDVIDPCIPGAHGCSHICIPSAGTYTCLCPDHLRLADDLRSCVTEEEAHLFTSTTTPHTTTTQPGTTTTEPWARIIGTTVALPPTTVESTTVAIEINTTVITETTARPQTTTTQMITTTTTMKPTTTTVPVDPYFVSCDETNTFELNLPPDRAFVNITPSLLNLKAYDGGRRPLLVTIRNNVDEAVRFLKMYAADAEYIVHFTATDSYGILATCNIQLRIRDVTPPRVSSCPTDMEVQTYAETGDAFVFWEAPEFTDNSGIAPSITQTYNPGGFRIGLYNITYSATDEAANVATCSFQIAVLQTVSACLAPPAPRNSKLTCGLMDGIQKCRITCDPRYRLALAEPFITCKENGRGQQATWIPYLNSGICTRPLVGNVQQEAHLQYSCPCRHDETYYDRTIKSLSRALKSYSDCITRDHKLGLCSSRNGEKLFLNCIDDQILNVTVTVDLENLRRVRDTNEVREIVKRSTNNILLKAAEGKIVTTGYGERRNYTVNSEALDVSKPNIVCEMGFIVVEDGCVECPKGTYWKNNKCVFCEEHHYQDRSGRDHCIECPPSKGTNIYGATDMSHCVSIERAESSSVNVNVIVAVSVGGFLAVAGICLIVAFVYWRKRNNKFKKEQERIKREQEAMARKRRRSKKRTRSSGSGRSTRERRSRNDSRNPSQQSNATDPKKSQRQATSRRTETKSRTSVEPAVPASSANPTQRSSHPPSSIATDEADTISRSETEVMTETDAASARTCDSDNKSAGAESAIFTDAASDTISVVSTDPPLKSALKKPKNPPSPPASYLEDDTSTVISASTITPAQLKRANIKVRTTSLDRDIKMNPSVQRGRASGRSTSMRRPSVSPANLRNDGHASMPVRPGGPRRSLSFDRGNTGPPRRMFPPRFNNAVVGSSQKAPLVVRMPPPSAVIRPPVVTSSHNYAMGGPRHPAAPIYGSYDPRRMPLPSGPMYPPNSQSLPFMGNRAGTLPVRQRSHYNSGYWNEGYENGPEWDQMQMRNGPDVRPPRMMTLPRQSMIPGYGLQNGGIPNQRTYHPRMKPPPYYA